MDTWIIILILFIFGLFEFAAGFSFNNKIRMIDEKRYTNAAALGAFSTVLFMMLSLLAPLVADQVGGVWFIFAGSAMMAVGNVLAVLALVPYNKWIESKKNKEETGSAEKGVDA